MFLHCITRGVVDNKYVLWVELGSQHLHIFGNVSRAERLPSPRFLQSSYAATSLVNRVRPPPGQDISNNLDVYMERTYIVPPNMAPRVSKMTTNTAYRGAMWWCNRAKSFLTRRCARIAEHVWGMRWKDCTKTQNLTCCRWLLRRVLFRFPLHLRVVF